MFAKPTAEHAWFESLLGHWKFTHECITGPNQPPQSTEGTVAVRTLGGLWTLMECEGVSPEGGTWTSLFSLGYDPQQQRFVGTFVASMMTHLWIYNGQLDSTGKRLILDVDGPSFDGQGMAHYQDIFEVVDADHWILRSQMQAPDGSWNPFMVGHHHRVE